MDSDPRTGEGRAAPVAPDDTPTRQSTLEAIIQEQCAITGGVNTLTDRCAGVIIKYVRAEVSRLREAADKWKAEFGEADRLADQMIIRAEAAEADVSRLQQENAKAIYREELLKEDHAKALEENALLRRSLEMLTKQLDEKDEDATVVERATARLTEAYRTIEALEGRLVVQGQSIEHYQARLKALEPAEADEQNTRH